MALQSRFSVGLYSAEAPRKGVTYVYFKFESVEYKKFESVVNRKSNFSEEYCIKRCDELILRVTLIILFKYFQIA